MGEFRCRFTREEVISKAKALFEDPSLSDEERMARLSMPYANKHYDWVSSAATHFGKKYHDWYGAVESLLVEVKGLSCEDARKRLEKIRNASTLAGNESSGKSQMKYSPEEVRSKFRELLRGLDFSDKDRLVQLSHVYARQHYDWFSSAGSAFGRSNSDWYGTLEKMLVDEAGLNPGDAKKRLGEIRNARELAGINSMRKKFLRYSPEEVRSKFRELLRGLDFSDDGQLAQLGFNFAQGNYAWFYSACSTFGRKGGDWYGALENLFEEIAGERVALEFVARIRKISVKFTRQESHSRYAAIEVREKFRLLLSGICLSDHDGLKKLTLVHAKNNYDWFASAGSWFGRNSQDWYGALEKLLAGTEGTEEAKQVVRDVRSIGKQILVMSNPRNNPKNTPDEVRKAFAKTIEGMDFTNPVRLATLSFNRARDSFDWWSSACTIFGDKRGDWYGALETLLGETREAGEAKKIVEGARAAAKQISSRNRGRKSQGQIVLVTSRKLSGGKSIDFTPMVGLLSCVQGQVLKNGSVENGAGQRIILSTEGERSPTDAQKVLFGLGTQDWDAIVAQYAASFSRLAPFVIHHLAVEKLLQLAKKGDIRWPETALSQASGISELHMAFTGLRSKVEAAGFRVPWILDLDASRAMLQAGANDDKVRADMRCMPFPDASFSLVENSSVYQFRNPLIVRDTLAEASRITECGGVLLLSSANKPFTETFHGAIRSIGFKPLGAPNESVALSDEFLGIAGRTLGVEFAERLAERVKGWHLLIAVRVHEAVNAQAEPGPFALARARRDRDPLLLDIGRVSRETFKSATLEGLDAGISAILGLLVQLEDVSPRETWKVYERIARLEERKLRALEAMGGYPQERGDIALKSQEFLRRLRLKSPANSNGQLPVGAPLKRTG
ncbi:MAG: class I SAM-dependent methyltransferase [Candidatus Micrarchaeota archaeon]